MFSLSEKETVVATNSEGSRAGEKPAAAGLQAASAAPRDGAARDKPGGEPVGTGTTLRSAALPDRGAQAGRDRERGVHLQGQVSTPSSHRERSVRAPPLSSPGRGSPPVPQTGQGPPPPSPALRARPGLAPPGEYPPDTTSGLGLPAESDRGHPPPPGSGPGPRRRPHPRAGASARPGPLAACGPPRPSCPGEGSGSHRQQRPAQPGPRLPGLASRARASEQAGGEGSVRPRSSRGRRLPKRRMEESAPRQLRTRAAPPPPPLPHAGRSRPPRSRRPMAAPPSYITQGREWGLHRNRGRRRRTSRGARMRQPSAPGRSRGHLPLPIPPLAHRGRGEKSPR
nr:proline-rich protein 2-like [Caretta caretta]